jgi:spore germination protein
MEIIVNGYAYPNISSEVLEAWLPELTYLLNFSYGITASGELIDLEDGNLQAAADNAGVGTLMVLTPFNENGQFSNELASQVLNNDAASANLARNIRDTVISKGMSGVDFDFEYVYAEDKDLYVSLVEDTAALLRPLGYTVTAALAPKTSAEQSGLLYAGHDYRGMGLAADYVLLMTYEWGYTYGPPMAVAPLNKVREVIEYGISEIEPSKILMGIPNYGYDWTLPFVKGESTARKISIDEAFAIAASYGAEIQFDETAQSPMFYYTDENDLEHIVWFEDERSLSAKLNLIDEYGLAGAAYWNIMTYYAGNTAVLNEMYDVVKI